MVLKEEQGVKKGYCGIGVCLAKAKDMVDLIARTSTSGVRVRLSSEDIRHGIALVRYDIP